MNKINLAKYVGRDYDNYNCFTLVKEFYKDHYDIVLKDYFEGPVPSEKEVENLIISNKGEFIPALVPAFGDIVTIKLWGIECHIGVCIDDKQFLHSVKYAGSGIAQLKKYKRLITGFYRHREASND